MRLNRLILAPLTAVAALAVASPSLAADFGIAVTDFKFTPKQQKVAVGDKVVWSFDNGGHSATSLPDQPDSWDSKVRDTGATFEKTFTKPGRYQYICTPHESFMKGTLVVGEDAVADTVDNFKTKVSDTKVTVSFKLNEAATATYKLTGAGKRTVKTKRLKSGARSITVKGLKKGSYKGVLTLTDDFDKKAVQKKPFTVR
ncbi:MAG: cupredoxin domain-containing protein [Thermoleophilaceae bacterium]|nr:cupredoxin domain-containing protein [Thermoleophilaceae bacterium]